MATLELIYDGECPVCSAYVRMHRLRESGSSLTLVDARRHPEIVAAYARRGIDLNHDMVLKVDGSEYVGGAAMFALSSMTAPTPALRKAAAALLASRTLSRTIYSVLRVSRWTLLSVLGREPIATPRTSPNIERGG